MSEEHMVGRKGWGQEVAIEAKQQVCSCSNNWTALAFAHGWDGPGDPAGPRNRTISCALWRTHPLVFLPGFSGLVLKLDGRSRLLSPGSRGLGPPPATWRRRALLRRFASCFSWGRAPGGLARWSEERIEMSRAARITTWVKSLDQPETH